MFALSRLLLCGAAAACLCAAPASAALLVSEDFNYPQGPVDGRSGGTGWKDGWIVSAGAAGTVESEAFTAPQGFGNLLGDKSLRIIPGERTAEARRFLASPFALSPARETTLYFNVFFSRTDTAAGMNEHVSFLFLRDRRGQQLVSFGANSAEALTISTAKNAGEEASAATPRTSMYLPGSTFATSRKYRVLGKMVLRPQGSKNDFYMSIFPADLPVPAQEPASWDVSLQADVSGTVEQFYFNAGSGTGMVNFAGFYFGSDYADVVGSGAAEQGRAQGTSAAADVAAASAQPVPVESQAAGSASLQAGKPSVPTIRNIWLEKHEGYNRVARGGNIDLLFIGDSITEGWRFRGEAPIVWREYYGTRRAENFGIGGDRVEHQLWRVMNSNWGNISPKLVVILIGTNNVATDSTPSEIAHGVLSVAAQVHQKLPNSKILLMGLFPRSEQPNHPFRLKVEQINKELAAVQYPPYVEYMDISDKFLQPDGVLPKSLFYDELHPTRRAHEIWAEAIEPVVKRALGEG